MPAPDHGTTIVKNFSFQFSPHGGLKPNLPPRWEKYGSIANGFPLVRKVAVQVKGQPRVRGFDYCDWFRG
jgi:hypothetical protein